MIPSLNENGQLCPAGSYCQKGVAIPCPKNTYQPNQGSSSCYPCPAGKQCLLTGMTEPVDCPPGSYCPQYDTSSGAPSNIIDCPEGSYSPFTGLQKSEDCIKCKEG